MGYDIMYAVTPHEYDLVINPATFQPLCGKCGGIDSKSSIHKITETPADAYDRAMGIIK